MKALKYSKPSHFNTELGQKRPYASGLILPGALTDHHGYFPISLSIGKSFPNHNLPKAKDELTMVELYRKKEELEGKHIQLEQEIVEKQKSLEMLQQAIHSATNELQSASAIHLAAGLAHEIRNPLTTIKGFIQLLKPELLNPGKQEFADVALEEINRANSLLTEFLSVLKPASSEKKKLSMNNLAAAMIKLFSSESILKDIRLCGNLPEEELSVYAEENAIKQVIVNLLKNAIEAVEGNHEKKGCIELAVNKDEGFVRVSVIDNGGGIDEYSLKKIFTPFYTTKADGTGMGLPISKQIIENHGGEMSVTTQPFKTIFTFSLPAI